LGEAGIFSDRCSVCTDDNVDYEFRRIGIGFGDESVLWNLPLQLLSALVKILESVGKLLLLLQLQIVLVELQSGPCIFDGVVRLGLNLSTFGIRKTQLDTIPNRRKPLYKPKKCQARNLRETMR